MPADPRAGERLAAARMGDLETAMWRLERRDPLLRASITAVAYLDRSPGYERLRRRVDLLSRVEPRFRDRVVDGPGGSPRWHPDPDFDLAYHVRAVRAPADGDAEPGRDAVLRLAEPIAGDGFDHARPLWQMTLVEGLAGGEAAVILKLHHTFTDGLGAARLALVLFGGEADSPDPDPEDLPALAEGVPPTAFGQLWEDVEHELARTGELARRAVPAVLGLLRQAIEAPEERAAAAVGRVRSLTRLAVPTTSPLSPVMTGRSLGTSLAALRVPLAETRERAHSAGGTINDAFVATVLDGLRRYHTKHGATPPALRVGVPISTRSADRVDDLANQVAPARIVAPLQLAEFGPRLAAVHDLVAAERAEPALAAMDALAAVANRLPVAAPAIGAVMRSMDVMASNVPGSPAPLFL
ncbi:MAG: wax ester/triacylglycerol synthase domain-containing protein, partial [Acidimicrobiales bacterium]